MRRSAIVAVRAAAVIAAVFAIYRLCILPYRGAAVEGEVQRRSEVADTAGGQRSVILARENLNDLTRIAAGRRLATSWYMLYGGNCTLLDRWPDAVDAYTRALTIDQRPEIYFYRGLARLHLGQHDAGVADLVTAARFDPFFTDQLGGELQKQVAAAARQ
ncbi:MAG TPA: hypothetical protein VG323_02675 [Thermoanaerobaculia bacterium]|nr:hypothetical protein [Thermoanaerobaculia bacterium]